MSWRSRQRFKNGAALGGRSWLCGGALALAVFGWTVLPASAGAQAKEEPRSAEEESGKDAEPSDELSPQPAQAERKDELFVVDRVIARFSAPETGGEAWPHFVFQRVLAFEARVSALEASGGVAQNPPFRPQHVQRAFEQHVAEELLASLEVTPALREEEVVAFAENAWLEAAARVNGEEKLLLAAKSEGLSEWEVRRIYLRRARAGLYLDRMIAPMLKPTELSLRRYWQKNRSQFGERTYAEVREELSRRWVFQRLREVTLEFYQNARSRLTIEFVEPR